MSDHDEKDRMTPEQFRKFQKLSNDQYAEIKGTGQQTPEMAARFTEQHKALRAERDRENNGTVKGPGGNNGGQGGSGQGDAKGSLKDHKVDNGQQDVAQGERHAHKLSEFRQNRNDITGQMDRSRTRDGTEHPGAKHEPRLDGTRPKADQQAEHGATPNKNTLASGSPSQMNPVRSEGTTTQHSKFLGTDNRTSNAATAKENTANQPSGSLKNERPASSSGQESNGDRSQRADSLRSRFNENSSSISNSGSQVQNSSNSPSNTTSARPENQERKR